MLINTSNKTTLKLNIVNTSNIGIILICSAPSGQKIFFWLKTFRYGYPKFTNCIILTYGEI